MRYREQWAMQSIKELKEDFLHFVWKHALFNQRKLTTTYGEEIEIIYRGIHNFDSGPDFSAARIKCNGIEWVGHVEIHRKASEWYVHQHHIDPNYDNVVLHVVLDNDKEVIRMDNTVIPCLELEGLIKSEVVEKYDLLTSSLASIPCANEFESVNRITRLTTLDRMIVERLEYKSDEVLTLLESNNGGWKETTFQLISKALGYKVNSDAMELLARRVGYQRLRKHGNNLLQIEAMLFGTAGMLAGNYNNSYYSSLRNEHEFLQKKYDLNTMEPVIWKFNRMRPANFPTIRIAQLAKLVATHHDLYSQFVAIKSVEDLVQLFEVEQSEYWQAHTRFGVEATGRFKSIGKDSIYRMLINVIAPLVFASGVYFKKQVLKDRAIDLLEKLPAENNRITRLWKELNLPISSALDSQASIQLMKNYCHEKRCLECGIGAELLK